jgi:hypothetical protein
VTTADEPRWPPRAVRERGDGAAAFDDTVGGVSGVRLPGGRPSTDPGSLDPAGNVLGLYQAPTLASRSSPSDRLAGQGGVRTDRGEQPEQPLCPRRRSTRSPGGSRHLAHAPRCHPWMRLVRMSPISTPMLSSRTWTQVLAGAGPNSKKVTLVAVPPIAL